MTVGYDYLCNMSKAFTIIMVDIKNLSELGIKPSTTSEVPTVRTP